MNNWVKMELGRAIQFNPPERISKGTIAKKIPMERLLAFGKKIKGFEYAEYIAGPRFRNGDTLVAKITPCLENGKTAQVDILDENEVAFGSSEFIVLRQNEFTINDFIFYLAKSPVFRKKAIGCMEGTSGRKRVNEGALKLQILPIPDLRTQQKIASVLSALDSKIELNNRINAELEAMAKTIYDYWFVQFDFPTSAEYAASVGKPDLNGKPYKSSGGKMVWNEELKREIPEGWEKGTLNSLGEIIGGSTPPKENEKCFSKNGTAWITPKDLSLNTGNKFITKGEWDVTEEGVKTSSLNVMPKGSILLSSRAPIGYLAISRENVTTNQGFKSFVPNKGFSTEYVYYTVQRMIPTIENNGVGSTFKEVSASTLKTIPIVLSNKKLVNDYTDKVKEIFERQNLLELENQKLTELRDWLLPMLMNGQVVVGGEEEVEMGMAAEPETKYGK